MSAVTSTLSLPDHHLADPLTEAYERASAYLAGLPTRPVGSRATLTQLRRSLAGPLPEAPADPSAVLTELADAIEPGLVATGSGRYFGFVIGGATPAALAADWLTSTWDQNAALYLASPAAAVVEEVAAAWLADVLGLPPGVSVGFVTGVQMANFTALAAARHEVLRRVGWDVEARGLTDAPRIRVLAGAGRHDTIDRALRFLGVGTGSVTEIPADGHGRMSVPALRRVIADVTGPLIVCSQVGNVNTGAIDRVGEICATAHQHGAWVHVDGAFGLWAAASPRLRPALSGVHLADSWATDAHKWLNVPYDSGLVLCAHPEAHAAAMGISAAYLPGGADGERDACNFNPELSRRARGFTVYAALRTLGRSGVAELVDRCCRHARRVADGLRGRPGIDVLNEVSLNQVLVRFHSVDHDDDLLTRQIVHEVQREGTCWVSGTTWDRSAAMRISVSNWSTDEADVDRSVDAIVRVAHAVAVHTASSPGTGQQRKASR